MRDMHNNIEVRRAISSVSVADNTAQVSQIVDRLGYESVEFAIALGSIADADATFAVLVEDGDAAELSGTPQPSPTTSCSGRKPTRGLSSPATMKRGESVTSVGSGTSVSRSRRVRTHPRL